MWTSDEDPSQTSHVVARLANKSLEIQWERFSSWIKLFQTILYIFRWREVNQVRGLISLDKNQYADRIIFKLGQKEALWLKLKAQSIEKCYHERRTLMNTLDEQGIIRSRRRLAKLNSNSILNTQFFYHPNTLQHDWWCWNVISTVIIQAWKVSDMDFNKNSEYSASDTHCWIAKNHCVLLGDTVPLFKLQLLLTHQGKVRRKLISLLLKFESNILGP